MSWNRKEVAALLMTGVAIINAIEIAIFSKWVDANIRIAESKSHSDNLATILSVIEWVGFLSTLALSAVWIGSRTLMARNLPIDDRLDSRISASVIAVFAAIALGWVAAIIW